MSDADFFHHGDEGPLTSYDQLQRVASLFREFPHPWFVSGGWAIDLFRGEQTRDHSDLEIGIFRSDQRAVRFLFAGSWRLAKVAPIPEHPEGQGWVPWYEGEYLELPIHQVKVKRQAGNPRVFEVFLNDTDRGVWWFRRNPEIRRPVGFMALRTPNGIPYLRPEIQLLYKARLMRDRDRHDFEGALPKLDEHQRVWLKRSLEEFLPGHEWLAQL